MIKIPLDTIIGRIKEKSGLSDAEIKQRIDKKLKQLSGLISEEGAAHIVANELGIKILEDPGKMKIKDVLAGMRNVEVSGKIIDVYEVRQFSTESRSGQVGSFLIGDETGVMRIVCWNDQTKLMENLKKDAVVKIEGGYAKENNLGRKEVHLGDRSKLTLNPAGIQIDEVKPRAEGTRKKIKDLAAADSNVEIMGAVVQVFDPKFFTVDKETGKRVSEKEGKYYLNDSPVKDITYSYVTNLFLDDGTDSVRVVCWKNQTQHLFGMSDEEILANREGSFESIKNDLLGKIVKFVGRASKNEMFDRVEFIPSLVINDPDPKDEIERLEKEKTAQERLPKVEPTPKKPSEMPPPVEKDTPKPQDKKDEKPKEAEEELMSLEELEELEDLE